MVDYRRTLYLPGVQNFVCAVVLFACPGLYGAITGLGAGGGKPSSTRFADITNSTLYGIYCVTAILAGSVLNIVGPRITLSIGAVGYAFYAAGLWYYDRTANEVFGIVGGAVLGVCAGLLWTTAAYMTMAYAEERDKGRYIAIQWIAVAIGSTVGAIIAFALTKNETEATGVATSVYTVFIVIMLASAAFCAFFMVAPKKVTRKDGTNVSPFMHGGWLEELKGVIKCFTDWKFIILVPSFFSSMLCLATQSGINAYYFDLRTRGLANIIFWGIQIPASALMTLILDNERFTRRTRGMMGITYAATPVIVGWICQCVWVNQGNQLNRNEDGPNVDWTNGSKFGLPLAIYALFGIVYATWQMACQWLIATYTNDPQVLARYAGFFHGTLAAGECISFGVDAVLTPLKSEVIAYFTVNMIGLIILYAMCWTNTSNSNYFKESNVVVPVHVVEEKGRYTEGISDVERNVAAINDRAKPEIMELR